MTGQGAPAGVSRWRWGAPSGVAIGAVLLLLLAGLVASGGASARSGRWQPKAGSPFLQPPEIHSVSGVLHVTLTAAERTVDVAGSRMRARVYNGMFTGPTLVVHPGDLLVVRLVNHLTEPTNLHFHGFHVSPVGTADNVFREVAPGGSFTYRFRLGKDEPTGLDWYHAHVHHLTERQVFGGLSGMIVVDGLTRLPAWPAGLRDVRQRLFALRDVRVVRGTVAANGMAIGSATRLVNSLYRPTLRIAPGETQLWRFANIGADLFYDVALPTSAGHRATFHVVAEDGRPVWHVWDATSLVLPPGKRFEVLVQGPPAGTYQLTALPYDQGAMRQRVGKPLATVVSTGMPQSPAAIPTGLVPKEDLRDEPVAATHTERFSEVASGFRINGKAYEPGRVDVTARLGTVQRWIIENDSEEQHPFHIHTDYFQVVRVNGAPVDANGLQDTVIVPPFGKVVILVEFEDFVGTTVFHCHILFHEDRGMMATLQVLPAK